MEGAISHADFNSNTHNEQNEYINISSKLRVKGNLLFKNVLAPFVNKR